MHVRENVTQPADPSYRLIALTLGQVAKVDTQDFERFNVFKWSALWTKNTNSFRAVRVVRTGKTKHTIYMHREVKRANSGDPIVDHKNHDTLDNRNDNLRWAGDGANQLNTRLRRDNRAGAKGVHFRNAGLKHWRAQIRRNGVVLTGSFETKEEAVEWRALRAAEMHGEFAHA